MSKRLTGARLPVQDQRDALDKLEGMPLAPSFVGSAIKHLVPQVYAPGGLGWTEHLCSFAESDDKLTATLDVPTDVAARQQGKSTTVSGRGVTVDLRAAVDVPDVAIVVGVDIGGK